MLASTAAALRLGDKEMMLLDGINPLNPFPAGFPTYVNPYAFKYQYPPVRDNGYRGVYVSDWGMTAVATAAVGAVAAWQQSYCWCRQQLGTTDARASGLV